MDDFDFTAQPAANKPLILHLAQLAWAQEQMNVCFFGPPGTGKTHLAIALADQGLPGRPQGRVRDRPAMDRPPRASPAPQCPRRRTLRRLERYSL